MKYLSEIFKVCLEEQTLSVFGIQLLERALSRNATGVNDRDHALELLSLLLAVRASLRERISSVEREVKDLPEFSGGYLRIRLEFDQNHQRASIDDYTVQMATYCHLSEDKLILESLQSGSTLVDLLITGSTCLADVFRFIRYSLSFATVAIMQAGRLKREYSRLSEGPVKRKSKKTARVMAAGNSTGKRRAISEPSVANVTKEIIGVRLETAKPIEVFVDAMKEQVLIVDGRVRVTITLGAQ
jgi:hypothetical protein